MNMKYIKNISSQLIIYCILMLFISCSNVKDVDIKGQIMINEAALILQEGIVDGADTVDIGMIMGTGFPPFRGGLLRYADSIGIDQLVTDMEDLENNMKTINK